MKRIIRDRYLTAEETANYEKIRDEIQAERPEIDARIRAHVADLRATKTADKKKHETNGKKKAQKTKRKRGRSAR